MAGRIRSIKPEAFKDAELWDAELTSGLPLFRAYAALWCQADKEGRFVWKPRELKIECLPYFDGDFERVLDALVTGGWLVKYTSGTSAYGFLPNFKKHQHINGREPDSKLPEPVTLVEVPKPSGRVEDVSDSRSERVDDTSTARASREADAPIPSPSLPDPNPDPDPRGDATGPVVDASAPPDQRGRFRMHSGWRPSENSVAAVGVQLVEDWAIPLFVGEFVGHFAETDELRTNPEWNQRWQKWVSRGWNDLSKRPKRPPDDGARGAGADAEAAARRARHEERIRLETEKAKAALEARKQPPRDAGDFTEGIG